jgi:hypothetical protein
VSAVVIIAYIWMLGLFAWTSYVVSQAYAQRKPFWVGHSTFMVLLSLYFILRVAFA